MSAGLRHSCAVTGDDLYCWGENSNGELGIDSTTPSSVPIMVPL
ncbi:hypothetical protein [Rhodococcus chondri]|uniref:Uncharacterized protein n=1 Tax=Rhodococcus chondri TaxID=3065941 RepID=A0ABU7K100_9NOCA|nr:hypothetical protein [Rhodococcus sp. CC-R104]MEE2035519.1 hypothetical protein [Rhodococcus sp. CC-R104]